MPKLRSPILGFNHNLRHGGRVFHVQTEDSGVANPRIFTHLFHEGVIIATKKYDYDAEADGDIVKSLMQAQHKAVLRELKDGRFDEKIAWLLGEAGAPAPVAMEPSGPLEPEELADELPDLIIDDQDDDAEYAQIIVDNPGVSLIAGTLEEKEDDDDIDVSGAFRRIATPNAAEVRRAVTPSPVTVSPARPAEPARPRAAPGQWMITRTGQQERPFEKSGPVPAPPAPAAPPPIPAAARSQAPPPRPRQPTPVKLPEVPTPPPPPLVQRRRPSATQPAAPAAPPQEARRPAPPPVAAPAAPSAAASRANTAPLLPVVPPAPRVPAAAAPPPAAPRAKPMDSIVVARPAVVIGAPAPERKPARESTPQPESIFGQDLISEKSLDEVIMAYLSEDANDD